MVEAIEAGADLALIACILVLIGLLLAAKWITKPIVALLDVSILGQRPFHFLASALEGLIVNGADAGIKALEHALARLFSGVVDSLGLLIGVPLVLGLAVKDALSYLWSRLLVPKIRSVTDHIVITATNALSRVESLERTVANDVSNLERYAESHATAALNEAKAYAREVAGAGERAAEKYASQAVDQLRAAESQAISSARAIAVGAAHELDVIEGALSATQLGALLAALPAIAALTHAIATEAGLENRACREKVGKVCQADSAKWGRLLGGLTLMTGAISLAELVGPARVIMRATEGLVKAAA